MMSLVIVGLLLFNVIIFYNQNEIESFDFDQEIKTFDIENKPNVYFILLDAHAGKKQLEMDFGYDLTKFYNELQKRGFTIPEKSYSNYPNTEFSAPSLMNMMYLDFLANEVGIDSKNMIPAQIMLKQNAVMKIFEQNDYKVVTFYGGGGATGDDSFVDEKLCRNNTNNMDLRTTFVKTYLPFTYFKNSLIGDFHREKIDCFFTTIENYKEDQEIPVYVHGHIRLPHFPYVYTQDGQHVYTNNDGDKDAYLEQLIFTDNKTLELVDAIQNRSFESVIIIISDHGFRPDINWDDPSNEDFIRGFNTISAFYFPGKDLEIQEVSSVNTFRIFFNTYFDANYEILDDRHIWYTAEHPYRFTEIPNDFKN